MGSVLLILPTTRIGGAEQFLRMIALHYANLGYRITVFFLKKESHNHWKELEQINNIELIYLNNQNSEIKGWIPLIRTLFKRRSNKYEYVFSSHVHINSCIGMFRKFNLIKSNYIVARESTSVFLRYKGAILFIFKIFYNLGYSSIDLLICQTQIMKNQYVNALPKLSKRIKIEVIPNPIDLNFIEVQSKQIPDLHIEKPYIVAAGRLIHLKGFDLLIEAFSEIVKLRPSLNLMILGEGPDREKLTQLIVSKGLSNKVFLSGLKSNVFPYFKEAELCVVSSRIEGFPNVLLQMMSQNLNVVSTLCSGDIENIPGITTCSTGDAIALYKAIEMNLSMNKENTRVIFDEFLEKRTISSFSKRVETLLNQKQM